jgi:hypothetical protein
VGRHLAIADAIDAVKLGGCHACLSAREILVEILVAQLGEVHAWKVHIHGGKLEEHVVTELIKQHAPAAKKPKQSIIFIMYETFFLMMQCDAQDNN